MRSFFLCTFVMTALSAPYVAVAHVDKNTPTSLAASSFTQVKKLIKPQTNEGLWRHIPWETSLTAARQKAAAAGKPLLIWAGGGSAPLGGC